MKNICFPSQEDWNSMSKKEQREFKESFDALQRKAEEISKQGELLEKISSQRLLQELVKRRDLLKVPTSGNQDYVLRRPYQQDAAVYRDVYLLRKRGE